MKCLTIKQPWAWLIIHGTKRIENRTWATSHRGPLLIHAGKNQSDLIVCNEFGVPREELVFGAIIGVVEVTDCVPLTEVEGQSFADGPWCWVLENPRAITPRPLAGKLWLFDVDFTL